MMKTQTAVSARQLGEAAIGLLMVAVEKAQEEYEQAAKNCRYVVAEQQANLANPDPGAQWEATGEESSEPDYSIGLFRTQTDAYNRVQSYSRALVDLQAGNNGGVNL